MFGSFWRTGVLGLIFAVLSGIRALAVQTPLTARITVDTTQPGARIDGRIWGTNLTNESRTADRTVHDAAFVAAAQQMGVRIVRWPGGNNADGYDWKHNVQIKPGRRVPWDGAITLPEIAAFCREIGAELSITVNFGSGTPEDAADLVEYCNGPPDSKWGSLRASQGFPEPLNVRYFEIGNEINQPHQWYYSWTAENPYKYFFGGEEERRGDYLASANLDPIGKKGDVFKAVGGSGQSYVLRFPPVRNVRVFWAATQQDAQNGNFVKWQQVDDLQSFGPDAQVFVLDSLSGTLTFGDQVHGAAPPQGSWFLVEYTTYGHKGFVDFARAMRQAPSSVPIQIGAVTGPFVQQTPVASADSLRMILEQMDFLISHQYGAGFPTDTYSRRRQMAYERTRGTARTRLIRMQAAADSLGVDKTFGLAITEWNVFLDEDSWRLNRTLEGGVIAAEFFIRLLNADAEFPVWFAQQFALGGVWLALYNNWTSFSICPMGYVFQGFKPWKGAVKLAAAVDSPGAMAYDRVLPFINAAAARSADGDTLFLALSNSAENDAVLCRIAISGFEYAGGRLFRLEGDSPTAHNDGGDPFRVALQETRFSSGEADSLVMQPHSVVFIEMYAETSTSVQEEKDAPADFRLLQNYPNPFNAATRLVYSLPSAAHVQLEVRSPDGRRVAVLVDEWQAPGLHRVDFNASNLPSGLYLLRLHAGKRRKTIKALLMK